MENIKTFKQYVKDLFVTANKLAEITGRPFPLDGHTLGSIGEVYGKIFYGIELHKPGHKDYDGVWKGKDVQIKATQRNNTSYTKGGKGLLLVLRIMSNGEFEEIYNGDARRPWDSLNQRGQSRSINKAGEKMIPLNQLRELNKSTKSKDRISKK